MTPAMEQARAALQADYDAACAERDAVNAINAPIEAELEKANAEAEAARVKAQELAAQIDANRGHEKWLDLKRRIGRMAEGLMALRSQA